MKFSCLAVSTLALCSSVSIAAEIVAPQSENDKAIYSLGYDLGTELKDHTLKLNQELLLQGVKDAIEGNKPLVKTTGRNRALAQIREQRLQHNLEQSKAFLAENAKKEGVVALDSGLQYRVIKAGEGKSPQATDRISVNYRGTLIDGTEFDSSHERGKPASFQLKKVIKGWREALQLMKKGAKWELYIPPGLAYGKRTPNKTIPPNSALIYEVELLAFTASPKEQKRAPRPPVPGAKPREE